ncbi:MAG: GNAT family N-acetyltransferase [Henriciella sp.]|nr:GNAT family N-acetyltransferase [Henriciella sp.]
MYALPEGYAITEAGIGDIPAIVEADKAAAKLFAPTGLLRPEALNDHVPVDVLTTEITDKNVFVMRDEADIAVGFILIRPRGTGLYLDQISVHPDHGQKGLGSALMLTVIEQAEERRLPHVSLSTFRDLPWNGPFYASLGFKELPRDKYEPYMFEIEEAQEPLMDITKRCFMRRRVRRPLFRFKKPVQARI